MFWAILVPPLLCSCKTNINVGPITADCFLISISIGQCLTNVSTPSLTCCFVLFWVYRPTREFFIHMETSPLPVKDCKCWPMLGIHSHCAVRVLNSATPTVTRGIRLYCQALSSRTATTCFYHLRLSRLEFEHPTFRLRDQRSNPLRHRRRSNDWLLNLPEVFNTVVKVLVRVSSTESIIG